MIIEITCKNCRYCDVHTGNDLCKRLKCMATPTAKTLAWHMLSFDTNGKAANLYTYFADYLEKHKRPDWCPLCETHKDGVLYHENITSVNADSSEENNDDKISGDIFDDTFED